MIWLHEGGFAPAGTLISTYTDQSFSGPVYYLPNMGSNPSWKYTAFVATGDSLNGKVDIAGMIKYLVNLGYISPNEYVADIEFGAEVAAGTGSLTVNSMNLDTESLTGAYYNSGTVSAIVGSASVNRLFLTRSSATTPFSFTFAPGQSTPVSLPDGTTFKNIQLLYLTTGSGADNIAFNAPMLPQTNSPDSWDGGAGNDTATVNLSSVGAAIKSIYSGSAYLVQEFVGGGWKTVVSLTNIENFKILGGSGGDTFTGGSGNDTFTGGAGNDTLNGGSGNDTLIGSTGNDKLDGGAGTDTASYSGATSGVTVNLSIATAQAVGGGQGSDTLTSIENLIGSSYADKLTGNSGNNILTSGAGNDTLSGGAGADHLAGGAGNDTYIVDNTGDVVTEVASAGTDTVKTTLLSYTLGVNVENLIFSGTGNFAGTGNALANVIKGGAGNDTLSGLAGNDTFNLGAAFTASDKIDGGSGTDTLNLSGNYSAGVTFGSTTLVNVEKIVLAAGFNYKLTTNNTTVASGQTLTINGAALSASNVLTFSGAAETNGHFIIIGGKGGDKLTGGTLSDTFTYTSAAQSTSTHYDTITGFNFSSDKFDIPGVAGVITGINAKVTSGSLSTATFDANLAAAISSSHLGAHHAVLFTPNGGTLSGDTFLVVDLNGVAGYQTGSDLVVRLTGQTGTLAIAGFI
jgi:Ca2+-binding RTX toxin-like protein